MRIVFRGTDENNNFAPEVMAAFAAANALCKSRHTLCLQFMRGHSIEKLLSGRQTGVDINGGNYDISNSGVDSLLRKIEFSRVDKDTFELDAKSITKEKFLLDVASASLNPDFEDEVSNKSDAVKKLVETAEKNGLYADIFILANGQKPKQIEMLNEIADLSIICIPQGSMNKISAPGAPDKIIYLVTEFDRRSMFDEKKMKKIYNTKKLAVFPYNPDFKDAYNTNNVFNYIATNSSPDKNDYSQELIRNILEVLNNTVGGKEEEDVNFPKLHRPHSIVPVRREKVLLDKTNVINIVSFLGFFKKKKKTTIEVLNDHTANKDYVYDREYIETEGNEIAENDEGLEDPEITEFDEWEESEDSEFDNIDIEFEDDEIEGGDELESFEDEDFSISEEFDENPTETSPEFSEVEPDPKVFDAVPEQIKEEPVPQPVQQPVHKKKKHHKKLPVKVEV